MSPGERVSAVVVNYNAGRQLVECVRSLRSEGVDHIVVVDSASTDDSIEQLESADSAVAIVRAPNRGFGAGTNRAVAAAEPRELIFVVNPDVVVESGALKTLTHTLDSDAGIGLVGPHIRTIEGRWYPSARRFPSLTDALGHAFLGVVWPRNPYTSRYRMLDRDPYHAGTADWVSGSCMLIRRRAWESVGGFDEAYFMYVEDVDLCWQLWRAGWSVVYEPAAMVMHVQGLSTDQVPYKMIVAHHRSLFRFARKTARGRRRALLPVIAAGLALRTALACGHRLLTGRFRSADL